MLKVMPVYIIGVLAVPTHEETKPRTCAVLPSFDVHAVVHGHYQLNTKLYCHAQQHVLLSLFDMLHISAKKKP